MIDTKIGSETVTTVNVTGTVNGVGIEKIVTGTAAGVKGHTLLTASDPATLALAPAHRTGTGLGLLLVPLRTGPVAAAIVLRPPRNMLGSVIAGI